MSLRTPETEALYQSVLTNNTGRALKDVTAMHEWNHWKLIPNQYPYDAFFKYHHMLIPKRVVAVRRLLTLEEDQELTRILRVVETQYDCIMENFPRRRTVPSHFHLHLMTYK